MQALTMQVPTMSARPQAHAASTKKFLAWLSPSWVWAGNAENTSAPRLFRRPARPSHRRRQPVAADTDAVGFELAIRQLFGEGDHLGAGLQVGFVGRHIGHDRGVRRNHDFLLAVLVFD